MSSDGSNSENNRITIAVHRFLEGSIAKTAGAMYAAQFANYLLPLLMIPYLARVLGPDVWGVVAFIQAIGMYLLLVIDYAFDMSATRAVAQNRNDGETLASIVQGVLGARILLAVCGIVVIGLAQLFTPALRDLGWLLWLGVFWFTFAAMRPFWFFLGLEEVRNVLVIEVVLKTGGVALVLFLVNSPADAWMIFVFQGGAAGIATLTAMGLMYRRVLFRLPSVGGSLEALREGRNLFVFQASTGIYGTSNSLILGLLANPSAVAFYVGAERIVRVLIRLIITGGQAMLPRASALARNDPAGSARFARMSTITVFSVTLTAFVALFLMAPTIIRVALGENYQESVTVLRILLLVLPIMGISMPIGSQWLIPNGHDSLLTRVTVAGGMFHIPLAVVLGINFSHVGVAWALVITESVVLAVLLVVMLARGIWPNTPKQAKNLENTGQESVGA